jgi:hypothetical protein
VLLSTPLHASSNFTVSVQLANKRGFKQKKNSTSQNAASSIAQLLVVMLQMPNPGTRFENMICGISE